MSEIFSGRQDEISDIHAVIPKDYVQNQIQFIATGGTVCLREADKGKPRANSDKPKIHVKHLLDISLKLLQVKFLARDGDSNSVFASLRSFEVRDFCTIPEAVRHLPSSEKRARLESSQTN